MGELTEQVGKLWVEDAKFDYWLRIEKAYVEGLGKFKIAPMPDVAFIREHADFNLADVERYERISHHDVNAFLSSVADSLDSKWFKKDHSPSRWVHYGLTSSDVVDTALSMRIVETLEYCMNWSQGMYLAGLTPYLASQLGRLIEECAVGQLSGPVGSHATVGSELEQHTLALLGLDVDRVSTQVISRDRHANYALTLARLTGMLERIYKQKSRREVVDYARGARAAAMSMLDSVALWHERDISHSSVERLALPQVSNNFAAALELIRKVEPSLRNVDSPPKSVK